MRKKPSKRNRSRRILDFLLYIAIGIALLVANLISVGYGWPENSETTYKWIAFVINTLVLFGYAIQRNKILRPLRRPDYALLTVLLLFHSIVWTVILRRVDDFRLLWFLIMYPIEEPLLDKALDWNDECSPTVEK